MSYTIGGMILDARNIVNDVVQTDGSFRYSDQEFYNAFNDAMQQVRFKRPDAFLNIGLRNTVPQYNYLTDANTLFPLDSWYYPAFVMYLCGRVELKEDTFSDDKRAPVLMAKFVQMIMQVAG
jgi:hypothetical protein